MGSMRRNQEQLIRNMTYKFGFSLDPYEFSSIYPTKVPLPTEDHGDNNTKEYNNDNN